MLAVYSGEADMDGMNERQLFAEPSLFDEEYQIEPRSLSRLDDPETSHAAAKSLDAGAVGTMRRRLLAAFYRYPSLTADEACNVAGFGPADGAWKRVSDLRNLRLIEPTGETRPGASGRQQRVLRITPVGREACE